ncbi:MAG: hypothetical protein M3Y72_10630 [Acidobacteriota bacterium]|nr:hypothetical protein [Acidobacteriota bacterium]
MKHLSVISACVFCFALGTLMPLKNLHAQADTPKQTYYMISFMKTKPGQDPIKMEQDLWKPIQADRVAQGAIDSWTIMQPLFFGPHPYDYLTVETSTSREKLTSTNYVPAMKKAWGTDKSKYNENFERTMNARDQVGNELWVSVDGVPRPVR